MSIEQLGPIELSPLGRSVEDFLGAVETYRPQMLEEAESAASLLNRQHFAVAIREQGVDVDFEDWDGLTDLEFLSVAKHIVISRRN